MTDIPKQLPLTCFLRNASELLDATAKNALDLQAHLASFMASGPDGHGQSLDLVIMQSLDMMTQTLADLSTAFIATSQRTEDVPVSEWGQVVDGLKLEYVGRALTYGGRENNPQPSNIELF